jgi:hypothetical protein
MSSFWDTPAGKSSGGGTVSSASATDSLVGLCVSIPGEVKAIRAGNSSGWHDSADKGADTGQQVYDLSTETIEVGKTLRAAWSGKAADAAIARLDALGYALNMTSDTFAANARNVKGQAEFFDYTRGNLADLPDPPPDQALAQMGPSPWLVDTEALVKDYNAKQQHNTDLYNAYASHGSASGGSLSADYGQLAAFNAGSISVGDPAAAPPPQAKTSAGAGGKHRAPDNPPATSGSPSVNSPSGAIPPPAAGHPGGVGGGIAGGGNSAAGPSPTGSGGEGTTTAGATPPAPGFPPSGGAGGLVPPLSSGPGVGSGSGSTPSPLSGVGGLGGFLDGAGGMGGKTPAGPGAGSGLPGGGRQTGARGGMVDEPVRGGGAADSSKGGSRGQGGPGGMGQAGRGKSEEEREHERKYMLDTDTLFTDEDRKELDPTTGLPPVPPTIGA